MNSPDHLTKVYSLNQNQLTSARLSEIQSAIDFVSETLINQNLVSEQGVEILSLIKAYTKTWDVLLRYDEDRLHIPKPTNANLSNILSYEETKDAIQDLKLTLAATSSDLFGRELNNALSGIIGSIDQTFAGDVCMIHLNPKRHIYSILSSKITHSVMVIKELVVYHSYYT